MLPEVLDRPGRAPTIEILRDATRTYFRTPSERPIKLVFCSSPIRTAMSKLSVDQVHAPIRDAQFELDIRIALEEGTGPRGDQRAPERRYHTHPKQAAHAPGNLDDVISFLDGPQMGSHAVVICNTLGSRAERACRPLQKAHARRCSRRATLLILPTVWHRSTGPRWHRIMCQSSCTKATSPPPLSRIVAIPDIHS